MKLTVLGKYGPFPKEGGACSAYLLQHNGKNILIDCGSGCLAALQSFIHIKDIHMIILSHLHYDHIGDMAILRYALEILEKRGYGVSLPIPVYMPEAPEKPAQIIKDCPTFAVLPVTEDTVLDVFGMRVTFKKMTHPVPSYAMRFESEGKAFVYSGDTNMNGEIIPFAAGCDLLLMEAGLLAKDKKDNTAPHVSATEAGLIAREAGVKRLIATHLYPYYDEAEVLREVSCQYSEAQIAQEKQAIEI